MPPLPWTGAYVRSGVLPEDLAVEVETRGPHVAEVDVEALAVEDRRRAGVAVLAVDAASSVRRKTSLSQTTLPVSASRHRRGAIGPCRPGRRWSDRCGLPRRPATTSPRRESLASRRRSWWAPFGRQATVATRPWPVGPRNSGQLSAAAEQSAKSLEPRTRWRAGSVSDRSAPVAHAPGSP